MREEEIIMLYEQRSAEALTQTSNAYRGMCLKLAYNVLRDARDAEECVNDVFLRAWESIPPAPASLSAYLTKLTRNLALERLRMKTAQKRGGGELPLILEELEESVPAPDGMEGVSDSITIRNALECFLNELSREDRSVFVDRYFRFMTVAEIAQKHGCGESKVKSKLARMRKKLERHLRKEGVEL